MTATSVAQKLCLLRAVDALPENAVERSGSRDVFGRVPRIVVIGNGAVTKGGQRAAEEQLDTTSKVLVVRFNDYSRFGCMPKVKSSLLCINSETSKKTVQKAIAEKNPIFCMDRNKRKFNRTFYEKNKAAAVILKIKDKHWLRFP